jgi:hypothetical protein
VRSRNAASRSRVTAETQGCGRFYVFNVDSLIESAGPDYVVPDIVPGVPCRACGGDLKFMLAMVVPEE